MIVAKRKKIIIGSLIVLIMVMGIGSTVFVKASVAQEWVGWLIDLDCVGANPKTHTQGCNLMPTCIASGEGIYVYTAGKAYNSYGSSDWIPFDEASQNIAKELNHKLSDPNDPEAYLSKYPNKIPTIKVKGYLVTSGLPQTVTGGEYGNFPNGIHITSIEFYYIENVSNYQVTDPENVVLYLSSEAAQKPTDTPTPAATVTDVQTPTPTSTASTSTQTPSPVSTQTPSSTPTSSPIPTLTATSSLTPTPASTPTPSVYATGSSDEKNITNVSAKKETIVSLNGNSLKFDVPPQIVNGRTLVPFRKIFEALGATVTWDKTTQTVTAAKNNRTIKLRIGNKKYLLDGVEKELDVAGIIVAGRTLVPVRVVAESFGAKVDWDEKNRTVTIKGDAFK